MPDVYLHEIGLETELFLLFTKCIPQPRFRSWLISVNLYPEIVQYWVTQKDFLDCFSHSGDFCKDLFSIPFAKTWRLMRQQ
jgi:hypothetical protein